MKSSAAASTRPGPFQFTVQERELSRAERRAAARAARGELTKDSTAVAAEYDGEDVTSTMAEPPLRRYDCHNYERCLNLTAALNWNSFTCRGCDGSIEPDLYRRACDRTQRDVLAHALCELPAASSSNTDQPEVDSPQHRNDIDLMK